MDVIELHTWSEFRARIAADHQVLPTYWRGQVDPAWPLASSYEREILRSAGGWRPSASKLYPYDDRYHRGGKLIWEAGFYERMRDRYLAAFRRASAGLRGPNPAELSDEQWWSLGRHYGLTTPLLDWTESPYIAAFFALSELLPTMRTRSGLSFDGRAVAVYRLFHNEQLEGDGLRIVRPTVEELGRMHGQRGLFTWLNSEQYFELQGFMDNTGRGSLLTKLVLSDQAVLDGLRDLKAHGIDYRLLYPDLEGAAKASNAQWDVL